MSRCPDEQFGCSDCMFRETGLVAGYGFLACKTNDGDGWGVFLVFEHVVLTAESAETLRVPHTECDK